MQSYGLPVIVAINEFASDTKSEISALKDLTEALGVPVSLTQVFAKGGEGGLDLAEKLSGMLQENLILAIFMT